jgi:hypothetical protein
VQNRSRARLALYPLRLKGTSSLAFQTTPHTSAALVLYTQRTSRPGRRLDQVMRHAKACAVARAQDHCFIPQHIELLFLSPFQNAALARKLYNSASTCSRYKQPCLSSFAVCESVHDCSRAWRALYPPGANIYSVEDTLKRPHAFAALVTQLQRVLYSGGPSHQVTRRAKACTVALAQDFHLTPQSEEKVTVIFLKSAAHKGGLSNLGPADQKLGRCLPSSYTVHRDVHNHPLSLPLSLPLREEDNPFRLFLRVPHLCAGLAIQTRRISRSDRLPHQVARCAKACTTARALIRFPIPSSVKQLAQTSLQTTTRARAFSTFASPHFQPQRPHLQNYEAREKVHSRLWPL